MHAPRGYIQRFGIVDSGSKSRVERALTKNNAAPFRSTSCGYTCNLSRPRENCIPRSFDPLSFLFLFFLCLHFFVVQDMKRLKLGEQRRGTKVKGWMDGYGWMDGWTDERRKRTSSSLQKCSWTHLVETRFYYWPSIHTWVPPNLPSLPRRSTQILAWIESISSPEGSNGQEWTTGQFPRDSLRFFTLHAALPCVIPFLPVHLTIVPGPPKGKTSAYIQTEGKYRRASGQVHRGTT